MISDERDSIVRQLEEQGLSRRAIAKEVGVSRSTVDTILKHKGPRSKKAHNRIEEYHGPSPVMCPECRYTVILPCCICGYRKPKIRRVCKYRDNLYISITYVDNTSFAIHTSQAEDAWDDEYARTHRQCERE